MKLRQLPLEQSLVDNPTLTIESKDPVYLIEVSGAFSDRFAAFESPKHILVLKTNRAHNYAVLTAYDQGKEIGEFILHGRRQIRSYLGARGLKIPALEIATVLYPYCTKA